MYAEIPNSLVAKKSPRIEINKVYELQRFKILPAKSLYKAVDSPVMIQFTIYTQANIVRDPPSTFPSFIYRLMDFDQIPNVVGRTESFVVNKNSDIYLFLYRFVSMRTDFSFSSLIFQLTCGTWIKKKDVLGVLTDIKPLKKASKTNRSFIRDSHKQLKVSERITTVLPNIIFQVPYALFHPCNWYFLLTVIRQ
jgi:hypothetical protein